MELSPEMAYDHVKSRRRIVPRMETLEEGRWLDVSVIGKEGLLK